MLDLGLANPAIFLFGVLGLGSFLLSVVAGVYSLIRPTKVKSFGNWAVVTGATDGIGLAYCHEFAKNGLNVVLISRTQSRLDDAAAAIKKASPKVEVKTIQADFDSTSPDTYAKIEACLADIPVGILVNNVGRSYDHAEFYELLTTAQIESLIRMNITSTNNMTHMVLPGMVARKKGAIVNVGSAAGVIHTGDPLYAVYSGTKAYVDFFSRSLNIEYKSKGVHVQCVVPYFVPTKLSKIRRASFDKPSPENWVRHAVKAIGYEATVVPHPVHALEHYVIQKVLPSMLFVPALMGHHLGIRKAAYKKKTKAQ